MFFWMWPEVPLQTKTLGGVYQHPSVHSPLRPLALLTILLPFEGRCRCTLLSRQDGERETRSVSVETPIQFNSSLRRAAPPAVTHAHAHTRAAARPDASEAIE